ncbi:hypothetical protein C8R45DRAFT_934374 [Mycena sanguinolenta]|nr:hypothetical protein C8R45DRAFT_934374 [Mycena sanguinolenta]
MTLSASIIERSKARHACEQSQAATPAPQTLRSSSPPPMLDGFDSLNPFVPLPPRRATQNTPAKMVIMKSVGECASKSRKLNDNAQADYKHFLKTSHPLEREALHHLAILEVCTLFQDDTEQRQQKWELSKELSFPESDVFQDPRRKSGTPGLPEDDSLIKDCLSHPLSVDKNMIKTALKKSMNSKVKEEHNIVYATARILSSFGVAVQPMLSLYYHFALVHTEFVQNHSNGRQCSGRISQRRLTVVQVYGRKFQKTTLISTAIQQRPISSSRPIPLADNALKWLKHIHELAPKVRRVENDLRSRKQKCIQDDEEDEEEDQLVDGDSGNGDDGGNSDNSEPEPVSES